MSDLAFYTSTAATDTLETFRTNVNASLGKARQLTVSSKSAAYTVVDTEDFVNVDATSGAVTITLTASPSSGDAYTVRKSDASGNAVTVDGNGNNINGSATKSLAAQYDSVTVAYDGTEWAILAEV